jgi:tetratricopeptide (TPR) repeat protein
LRSIFCLLLLSIIAFADGFAQTNKAADSIIIAINSHVKNDSIRLNLYLELAKKSDDYTQSIKAAREAAKLATDLNLKNKLGEAYIIYAADTLYMGNDTLAFSLLNESLDIFKKSGNETGEANVYNGLGRVFQFRSQYFKAIEYSQKALALFEKNNNNELSGKANLDIGVYYYLLSDFVKADQYYLKAKNDFEKAGSMKLVTLALGNLAMTERKLKKYSSALQFYRDALPIQSQLNDSLGIAKTLQGIGITYNLMNKNDSALYYYNNSYVINKRNGFKLNVAENLNNIGITYNEMGRYQEAYFYMNESISLFRELKREMNERQVEINIGELFCNAPDSFFSEKTIPLSQRYHKAISLFEDIISYSKKSEDLDLESRGWQGLSRAYEKTGDHKNALDAYKKSVQLQDSIINEEKVAATTKQIDLIEFEKKEAVIQTTHLAEIKQQKTVKNALVTGAGILVVGGIISFLFYKRKRDAVQKQKEAEFKTEVSETEMKALRSQMNPHFIFNSLNSIGDYIAKNNTKPANEYLAKFAKLMRLILENSEKKEVPLSEDLKALELYMQLEALRMNQKFTYQIILDEGIDAENTLIPPLILQPFVENSIWHGISKKEGMGNILVHIKKEGEMINCVVEDDGIGRKLAAIQTEESKQIQKRSLGMKITRARINILNKVKNSTADVQLFDLSQGTRVEVKLPLELGF